MVHELAARGLNVIITARRRSHLERLADVVQSRVSVRIVEADLAAADGVDRVMRAAAEVDLGLVVSNAGFGLKGSFLDIPLERQQAMVRLNCLANMTLLHHAGNLLKRRGRGGIIVTASTAAWQGIPYAAAYAASKSFDLLLAEALAHELAEHHINVVALCPGPTATEGPTRTGVDAARMPIQPMTAQAVARAGLESLGQRHVVIPGRLNRAGAWLTRLFPRAFSARQAGRMIVRVTGSTAPPPHQ
jgi:short-subunit dehydrogenase